MACVGCVGWGGGRAKKHISGVETTVQKLTRCFTRYKNYVLRGKEIWRLTLSQGRYSHDKQTFMLGAWSIYHENSMFENAKNQHHGGSQDGT